ncbi:MAG: hypothetical protein RLZZ436_2519 [Planctomycetota bacterium]
MRAGDVNSPVTARVCAASVAAGACRGRTGRLTSAASLAVSGQGVSMESESSKVGETQETQGPWAAGQWRSLSGTTHCREGEAPAEPHPCRERFIDPCCVAKTLAIAHSVDQRSAARQEPRPPRSSPVFSQNFREPQGHWVAARRLICVSFAPCLSPERLGDLVTAAGWISRIGPAVTCSGGVVRDIDMPSS